MLTDTIMAFQVEDADHLKVGDQTYLVRGEPADLDDGLLFDTVDEEGEDTQVWFAPFDTVEIVVAWDEPVEIPDIEV
jgi:hypothetical protein